MSTQPGHPNTVESVLAVITATVCEENGKFFITINPDIRTVGTLLVLSQHIIKTANLSSELHI